MSREWAMPRVYVTSLMDQPCHISEWILSHMWTRLALFNVLVHSSRIHVTSHPCHVTRRNRWGDTYKIVVWQLWMSLALFSISLHLHSPRIWVMSHMWMGHVTHANRSCHTCEWVMSHMWIGHVTHVIGSCRMWISEWVMSHINESCHI